MVDFHYLPRAASGLLERALTASPVIVLMGARQTGKSTLVRSEPFLADRLYLTLDDPETREHARMAAGDLVRSAPRLTLDEVQREPDLLLAVKRAVDEDRPRRNGRFVLTGSTNLLLMHRVSETLAGRATHVNLWPLTRRERLGLGVSGVWTELLSAPVPDWLDLLEARHSTPADWREEVRAGGYPTPAVELQGDDARSLWFDGYVRTYLERDLQTLAAVANLVDFRRLMRAACLRLGAMVNQTELGRDTRIPRATAQRYLNLLETSFQVVRLEPYSVNRTKQDPEALLERPGARPVAERFRVRRGGAPGDPGPARPAGMAGQPGSGPGGPVLAHHDRPRGRLRDRDRRRAASRHRGRGARPPRLRRHPEPSRLPGGVPGPVHRRPPPPRRRRDAVDVRPDPRRPLVAGVVEPVGPLAARGGIAR